MKNERIGQWIDENGNTCFGIKPEPKQIKKAEKEENEIGIQKTAKSRGRKRPQG